MPDSTPLSFRADVRLLDFMRQADEPNLINLAAGVPGVDALPTEALNRAVQSALSRDGSKLYAYHHPEGDFRLRELLVQNLESRSVFSLQATQIVTTTGCTQALQILLTLLVKPGAVVACEAPAYYGMLELLSNAGAQVLPLLIQNGRSLDLALTERLLEKHRPVCLVLCSTLSNPSGVTVPLADRAALVQICRRLGIRIIEDDIYGELLDSGPIPPLLSFDPSGEVVSYVTSFSKSVSPGLRVGFCVPGTLHEAFAAKKCQQDLHSSVVTECILREFLEAGQLPAHLAWLRKRNQLRRSIALDAIQKHFPADCIVHPPAGGYMIWVDLPERVALDQLRTEARAQGVVFASGKVFFTQPQTTPSIRLNCAKASEEDLLKGITCLGKLAETLF